jgi:predicted nucleotidyltransferase
MLKTCGLAEVVQQALAPITPQIQTALIYGSIAKQQDNIDSDIDLLIISDSLSYADVFPFLEKATVELARAINPNIYTVADWKRKCAEKNAFVTRISTQKKIYLIGTENDAL